MKNEEEMWLGGFESPQYSPSIREEVESPSYKVNEAELKNINICLSLCSLKVKNLKKTHLQLEASILKKRKLSSIS